MRFAKEKGIKEGKAIPVSGEEPRSRLVKEHATPTQAAREMRSALAGLAGGLVS